MTVLALVPTVLAVLMLAAHFLRAGLLFAVVILIVLIPLLSLRRWWVPRLFQVLLVLAALEWVRTLIMQRGVRLAMGEPYARTAAILLGVALFTLLAAALFEVPPVRRWYRREEPSPGARA